MLIPFRTHSYRRSSCDRMYYSLILHRYVSVYESKVSLRVRLFFTPFAWRSGKPSITRLLESYDEGVLFGWVPWLQGGFIMVFLPRLPPAWVHYQGHSADGCDCDWDSISDCSWCANINLTRKDSRQHYTSPRSRCMTIISHSTMSLRSRYPNDFKILRWF